MVYLLPQILRAIVAEQLAVRKIARQYEDDIIISDNRYGVFRPLFSQYLSILR